MSNTLEATESTVLENDTLWPALWDWVKLEVGLQRLPDLLNFFLGTAYGGLPHPELVFNGSKASVLDDSTLEEGIAAINNQNDFHCDLRLLDCVTFVEVVLALCFATGDRLSAFQNSFIQHLKALRYQNGEPTFFHRNHFMCLDWIPNNSKYLQEWTSELGIQTREAVAVIQKQEWLLCHPVLNILREQAVACDRPLTSNDLKRALQKNEVNFSESETARLPFVPLQDLLDSPDVQERFPPVSVVSIVRPGWDLRESIGTCLNISHLGFAVREQGVLNFYHATRVDPKQVVRLPLYDYLLKCTETPTIQGIHVLRVKEPSHGG